MNYATKHFNLPYIWWSIIINWQAARGSRLDEDACWLQRTKNNKKKRFQFNAEIESEKKGKSPHYLLDIVTSQLAKKKIE